MTKDIINQNQSCTSPGDLH